MASLRSFTVRACVAPKEPLHAPPGEASGTEQAAPEDPIRPPPDWISIVLSRYPSLVSINVASARGSGYEVPVRKLLMASTKTLDSQLLSRIESIHAGLLVGGVALISGDSSAGWRETLERSVATMPSLQRLHGLVWCRTNWPSPADWVLLSARARAVLLNSGGNGFPEHMYSLWAQLGSKDMYWDEFGHLPAFFDTAIAKKVKLSELMKAVDLYRRIPALQHSFESLDSLIYHVLRKGLLEFVPELLLKWDALKERLPSGRICAVVPRHAIAEAIIDTDPDTASSFIWFPLLS
jgi:hypothetical protein